MYKRAGANSMLVAGKTIRKYWGVNPGWISLGSIPTGTYSFATDPIAVYDQYGQVSIGSGQSPWLKATFDAILP